MHVSALSRRAFDLTLPRLARCNYGFFGPSRRHHEANLPTLEDAAQAHSRFSRANENQSRTCGHQRTSSEGAGATRRLTAGVTFRQRVRKRAAAILRKRVEFENVLRAGSRVSSRNFVVRAVPNAVEHARLGIIAGRKAAARAVDRNRGKRLAREVFRCAELGAHDVAVQLRNDLRARTSAALRRELLELMEAAVRECGRRQDLRP
jgi:ribonuclease P protein component